MMVCVRAWVSARAVWRANVRLRIKSMVRVITSGVRVFVIVRVNVAVGRNGVCDGERVPVCDGERMQCARLTVLASMLGSVACWGCGWQASVFCSLPRLQSGRRAGCTKGYRRHCGGTVRCWCGNALERICGIVDTPNRCGIEASAVPQHIVKQPLESDPSQWVTPHRNFTRCTTHTCNTTADECGIHIHLQHTGTTRERTRNMMPAHTAWCGDGLISNPTKCTVVVVVSHKKRTPTGQLRVESFRSSEVQSTPLAVKSPVSEASPCRRKRSLPLITNAALSWLLAMRVGQLAVTHTSCVVKLALLMSWSSSKSMLSTGFGAGKRALLCNSLSSTRV
jgi:hypothetical protein